MEADNAARRVEQDVISSWAHHIAEFMEAHKEVGASADLYEVTEGSDCTSISTTPARATTSRMSPSTATPTSAASRSALRTRP